jgi:hypothetical protein
VYLLLLREIDGVTLEILEILGTLVNLHRLEWQPIRDTIQETRFSIEPSRNMRGDCGLVEMEID